MFWSFIGSGYTLFDKRPVYKRLSLDLRQKLRTNYKQAQVGIQLTLILKTFLNEFLLILEIVLVKENHGPF